MKLSKVVGYAENALAFALSDERLFAAIRSVWLFGSAVRGELTAKSDIDLFFDCRETDSELVNSRATVALRQFYDSHDIKKWQLLGIKNPISIQAGELKKWKLRTSVYAEGIILFGKAIKPEKYENNVLIVMELPKQKAKYLKIVRELFGRPEYKVAGLVQQNGGSKLSSSVFIVPREAFPKIRDVLGKHGISYRMYEFLTAGD